MNKKKKNIFIDTGVLYTVKSFFFDYYLFLRGFSQYIHYFFLIYYIEILFFIRLIYYFIIILNFILVFLSLVYNYCYDLNFNNYIFFLDWWFNNNSNIKAMRQPNPEIAAGPPYLKGGPPYLSSYSYNNRFCDNLPGQWRPDAEYEGSWDLPAAKYYLSDKWTFRDYLAGKTYFKIDNAWTYKYSPKNEWILLELEKDPTQISLWARLEKWADETADELSRDEFSPPREEQHAFGHKQISNFPHADLYNFEMQYWKDVSYYRTRNGWIWFVFRWTGNILYWYALCHLATDQTIWSESRFKMGWEY
jgi:hypothetical protein